MLKILFIDDEEWRVRSGKEHGVLPAHTFWAPTPEDAIRMLREDKWDVVFFDHDLAEAHYKGYAGGVPTGADIAKILVNEILPECKYEPVFLVHSLNSFGALMIHRILTDAGYKSTITPFSSLISGEIVIKFED